MFKTHNRGSTYSPGPRRTAMLSVLLLSFTGLPAVVAEASRYEIRTAASGARESYNATVLQDRPSAFWNIGSPGSGSEWDLTGHGHNARYIGRPAATRLPNGASAAKFNGTSQYMQVPDSAALSPATRGVLTLEAWVRPDTLTFPDTEGSGYVHWMGKGEPNKHEYVARMYSANNTEKPYRANRISGYLFNVSGGKGAGSHFQRDIRAGKWIHYVLVLNSKARSATYPRGYTKIYRDGKQMDQDSLIFEGTAIVPQRGNAPFRVGTRDLRSFFKGAIGKVAIYDKELPAQRIAAHYAAMTG